MSEKPHELLNPPELPAPSGYAHVVVPSEGKTVYLGGQTGCGPDGEIASDDLVEQFDLACGNVVSAIAAAGGRPEHMVSMQIYVTDASAYRAALKELGAAYRRHFGRHYPAMVVFEVGGFFYERARVELLCTAVLPSPPVS